MAGCVAQDQRHDGTRVSAVGYRDGSVVSKLDEDDRWSHFAGESRFSWRSGIKGDCAEVMEFAEVDGRLLNGLGESPEIELEYLRAHSEHLARRGSNIYRGKPRFSIFGSGNYSFAPWKVGISRLYKRLRFRLIPPEKGRPVMLDDTGYFLPCDSEREALQVLAVLNSNEVGEFYGSLIHWDSERPITVEVLSRLSLEKAASCLGLPLEDGEDERKERQGRLFAERAAESGQNSRQPGTWTGSPIG